MCSFVMSGSRLIGFSVDLSFATGAHEEQLCRLLGQKAHPSPACPFTGTSYWFNCEDCTAASNTKNTGRAPCFHLTCPYFSFVSLPVSSLSSNSEVQPDRSSCWECLLTVTTLSSFLQSPLEA